MKSPNFKNPPLNELVCGVQFDASKWSLAIESDFFQAIKNDFPIVESKLPLAIVFDSNSNGPTDMTSLVNPTSRSFFVEKSTNKIVQLQFGRIIFNWRKVEDGSSVYPRFNKVYGEFKAKFDLLTSVCSQHNVNLVPNQFELTYVDHIPVEDFSLSIGDTSSIFRFLNPIDSAADVDLFNLTYAISKKDLGSHLSTKIKSGIRNTDRKPVITLESTMLGKNNLSMDEWFDLSHQAINSYFLKIITDKAKAKWGLINE